MVITDVMLPRMSSLHRSARLRARKPASRCSIFRDTATGNRRDFIENPITMESLSGKIRTLLDRTL